MDAILEWDKELLIWVNSFHADWLDPVVLLVTRTEFWTPLYLILIYFAFKKTDREGWFVLAGIGLAILLADQITASVMKPLFQRLRPSREPALQGILHLVANSKGDVYTGGLYGFASSHAANTFATAFFFWKVFSGKFRWIWLLFLWAAAMTYTRLYLGVHYPGDILVGGMVGLGSGWAGFRLYQWLAAKFKKRNTPTPS